MLALPSTRRAWSRWARWARWAAGSLAVVLLAGGWFLRDFRHKSPERALGRGGGPGPAVLANTMLRDQGGAPLAAQAFADKALVLSFMFTSCPQVCPMQTRELARVQEALPDSLKSQVHFLSVSVDPEHDTPEALQAFAAATGIDLENWSLVTATPEATRKLAIQLNAVDPSAGSVLPAAHGTSVYLFDRGGRLLQRYMGKPLDRARLVREIEQVSRMDTGDTRTGS